MDRDTLIGVILITIVMVVWMYWIQPPPPDPSSQATDTTTAATDTEQVATPTPEDTATQPATDTATERQPPSQTRTQPQREKRKPKRDLALDTPQDAQVDTITVENNLYKASFSTNGATLISFILKEYTNSNEDTFVQMVDTARSGSISLTFTSTSNRIVDTRALYYSANTTEDTITVGEQPRSITFEVPVNEGAIRQTYTFKPDTYEIDMEISYENPSSFVARQGYDVVWHGGIPFTEENRETEAGKSGAFARSGGELESIKLEEEDTQEQTLRGTIEWTAVKNKFFTSAIIPGTSTEGARIRGHKIGVDPGGPPLWEDYTTRLLIPTASSEADSYRMYVGPMEYNRISQYGLGLYDMVDYGYAFLSWFTHPFATWIIIPVFHFLENFVPNYGLIIIIFAVLIKLLLYPMTKSAYTSMAKMSEMQPKMKEIQEKYEDDPQKQQQAMMKLYKEEGVNPIGGCLPMLLQFPIIITLWRFFPNSIEIRQKAFLWCNDLSAPDKILQLPFEIPFYGDYVAGFTLLMGISMMFTMQIQTGSTPDGGSQMKALKYIFPVMIFAIFNQFAAGLSLYYLIYNIVTALQQMYIKKTIHEDDAEEQATGGKNPQRKLRNPVSS